MRDSDITLDRKALACILWTVTGDQIVSILHHMKKNGVEKQEYTLLAYFWMEMHPDRQIQVTEDGEHFEATGNEERLEELLAQISGDSLQRFLEKKQGARQKSASEIYHEAGVERQYWNSYIQGKTRKINKKDIIFKLAFGLRLDRWETSYLLHINGFAYPVPESFGKREAIILAAIENQEYDRAKLDEQLYRAGEETLFSGE
ncbi:MAG: hypothetical protein LIO80_00290 [Lachnospiraceae bacterium]|nr:hypothetical protein [Lachnospiraceae bacterium]